MTIKTSKDATENETLDAVLTADETASRRSDERSDESNTDGDNESDIESDNGSAIDYEEETTLSDGFDCLRWSVFKDISNIQVYEDPSKKRTPSYHPSMVILSQKHQPRICLVTRSLPGLMPSAILKPPDTKDLAA